jgi:hypothetical protein
MFKKVQFHPVIIFFYLSDDADFFYDLDDVLYVTTSSINEQTVYESRR